MDTSKKDSKKKKESFKKGVKSLIVNAFWVYKVMFKLSPFDTSVLIVASLLMAIVPTITVYFSAKLIDEIISIAQTDITSLSELSLSSPLVIIILLTTLASLINRIARQTEWYVSKRFSRYHLRRFQHELNVQISNLDVAQHEMPEIANDIRKGKDNFFKIQNFANGSLRMAMDLVSVVIAGIISFSISPLITLMIIILSIPNNLIYARFIKKLWEYYNGTVEENRKSWWLGAIIVGERELPEHKIVGSHKSIGEMAKRLIYSLTNRENKVFSYRFKGTIVANILNSVTYIVAPLYLIGLLLQGQITLGSFTFYQAKFLDFSRDIDKMLAELLDMYDSAVYVSYVKDIFELETQIKSGSKKIEPGKPPKIEFKNVSFKYPNTKKYVLRNVNMTIEPSEEIAIVGENGAGKTTLIKLLLRYYDPTDGEILIDGIPLMDISLEHYYDEIGVLFQEYNAYSPLTVKDNISLGDTKNPTSMKRIKKAAKNADAAEFISKLENKYKQVLAKQFTGGTKLSTGQWQKLALARMFYRDRPVLILDEPTASIDAEAEYKIFKRIYEFFKKKTVIIISHRFSTVRNAGVIYVLKSGKIIEYGSHDKLLKKKGVYAKAFKLQAEGYELK